MLALAAASTLSPLSVSPVAALATREFLHPYTQVWSAALRLLRVDLAYEVQESDADTGFILFTYTQGKRQVNGSVEVLRLADGSRLTRVLAKIPAMPTYLETYLLERLRRKLDEEYGQPPMPAQKGKGDKPAADAGVTKP